MWTPDPAVIVTAEQKAEQAAADSLLAFERAIQAQIDIVARARGYHDGVHAASYAASTVPTWAAEVAAFVAWRDAVWLYAHTQLAAAQAQEREQPTVEGLIAELPNIEWPE